MKKLFIYSFVKFVALLHCGPTYPQRSWLWRIWTFTHWGCAFSKVTDFLVDWFWEEDFYWFSQFILMLKFDPWLWPNIYLLFHDFLICFWPNGFKKHLLKYTNKFSMIHNYLALKMDITLFFKKMNFLFLMMLCAMFGLNWPSGFRENV